jgi:peptide-methionine (S)-S-oxide reductase
MSQTAYFATGCFWGAERRFWNLSGVTQTSVGYMGGNKPDPTYKEVCSGTTNHAEIVEIIFDSQVISYQRLLAEFWVMHDPTSLNQQGGDIGTQYRSSIFTTTPDQMQQALASKEIYQNELTKNGMDQIVTEILPASGITYWLAEDYHQRYLEKNPNGYDCHSSTGVAFPTALASNNG